MNITISVALNNSAIRGNTMTRVIEIDDEDIEDYDEITREQFINDRVQEEVLSGMVAWDWEEAK